MEQNDRLKIFSTELQCFVYITQFSDTGLDLLVAATAAYSASARRGSHTAPRGGMFDIIESQGSVVCDLFDRSDDITHDAPLERTGSIPLHL